MEKKYSMLRTDRRGNTRQIGPHTLKELQQYYSYILEVGNSWDKKVNRFPKTIKTFVRNLNLAVNVACSDGYSGVHFRLKED